MQFIDINTNSILFVASKKYSGQNKVTVFIVLHFVKMFVWDRSVFNKYSYCCDLFCLGPKSRLCDCHCDLWVWYYNTTEITVWCMSSILIHMHSVSVKTICISEHYRAIVSYSLTPSQQVSVISWNINISVWLQSQVHCVTYYFVLMYEMFTSKMQEHITQSLFCHTGRAVLNQRSFQGNSRLSVNFAPCQHTFR